MSIQNNPFNNIYTLGSKVKQTTNQGNNQAVAQNVTQTTVTGNNDAFISQDIASLFSSGTGFTPSDILALGQKHSLAKQNGYTNIAAGYQHINQVFSGAPFIKDHFLRGVNDAYGNNFNDHIVQNGRANNAFSGKGNDFIAVKGEQNIVDAGDGNDTITMKQMANAKDPGYSILFGGNGNDTVKLYGSSSDWQENNGPVGNFVLQPNGRFYVNKNTGDVVQLTDVEHLTFAGNNKSIDLSAGS